MIFGKVKTILAKCLSLNEKEITMESSLRNDLGADSLDVAELVIDLEDTFDIEIPDEAIEENRTVGDIVRLIEEQSK